MSRRSVAKLFLIATALTVALTTTSTTQSADGSAADDRLTMEEAKKLKSPVPFTKESITRGKVLYVRECTECHGPDGKSLVDVVANATDLTDPRAWLSGTSEGEVYRSIRDGAGEAMPPFSDKMNKEDLWHMVNFLRSLWPESARPKLQEGTSP